MWKFFPFFNRYDFIYNQNLLCLTDFVRNSLYLSITYLPLTVLLSRNVNGAKATVWSQEKIRLRFKTSLWNFNCLCYYFRTTKKNNFDTFLKNKFSAFLQKTLSHPLFQSLEFQRLCRHLKFIASSCARKVTSMLYFYYYFLIWNIWSFTSCSKRKWRHVKTSWRNINGRSLEVLTRVWCVLCWRRVFHFCFVIFLTKNVSSDWNSRLVCYISLEFPYQSESRVFCMIYPNFVIE